MFEIKRFRPFSRKFVYGHEDGQFSLFPRGAFVYITSNVAVSFLLPFLLRRGKIRENCKSLRDRLMQLYNIFNPMVFKYLFGLYSRWFCSKVYIYIRLESRCYAFLALFLQGSIIYRESTLYDIIIRKI